jgi:hypothetical protein
MGTRTAAGGSGEREQPSLWRKELDMTHPPATDNTSMLTASTIKWCSLGWGEEILSIKQVYNDSR